MADNMPLVARIMVQHGGGGPPCGPGVAAGNGGGEGGEENTKNTKGIKNQMGKLLKQGQSHLSKTIGINIGTASILKQSQVFTGYIGTIFQLMGALVDVILAPFLPIMIPAIKLLASFIPLASELMKDTFEWLQKGFTGLSKGIREFSSKYLSWIPKLPEGTGRIMKKVLVAVLIGIFFARIFNVLSLFRKASAGTAKLSYGVLQGIFRNTLRMGGGIAAGGKGSTRFFGRATKFFGRGLMRFAMIGTLLTGMGGLLTRGVSGMTHALGKGFSVVKSGLGMGAAAVTRLVPRLIPPMGKNASLLSTIMTGVKNAAITSGKFIASVATSGFNVVKGGLVAAKNGIVSGAKAGFNVVKGGLTAAKDFIGAKFPIIGKAVDGVKAGAVAAKNFIGDKVGVMKKAVSDKIAMGKEWAKNSTDAIKTRLTAVKDGIRNRLTTVKSAITSGITNLGSNVKGFFTGLGDKLGGLLNKIPGVKKVVDIAKNVGNSVKNALGGAASKIGGFFGRGGGKAGEEGAKKAGGLFGRVTKGLGGVFP